MAKLSDGWNVETFVYDNGVLNVVVTNTDGTDIEVLSKEPGDDGEDGSKIIRFTTKEIKEEESAEKSYFKADNDDDEMIELDNLGEDIKNYFEKMFPRVSIEVYASPDKDSAYDIEFWLSSDEPEFDPITDEMVRLADDEHFINLVSGDETNFGLGFSIEVLSDTWL